MTCIKYSNYRAGERELKIIAQANYIIEEFDKQGFSMTVRQIHYEFVARGWMNDWWPEGPDKANSTKSYNRLKSILSRARMGGMISWTAIEDRGRPTYGTPFVESPAEAMKQARAEYALDLWHDQPFRPLVLVEKDGQLGVIGRVCREMRIDYASCHGYGSQSSLWRLGQKLHNYVMKGQRPIIFHLGDHDPSGLDMTRDNQEKLSLFAGTQIQLVRLALNMEQIEKYNPPPNPLKRDEITGRLTDSRAASYRAKHGDESYELESLKPTVSAGAVRDAVIKVRDERKWATALAEEAEDKDRLDRIIEGLE